MVERQLPKLDVVGSIPITRSNSSFHRGAIALRILWIFVLSAVLAPGLALAQPKELPRLFDARERIAKPDLSGLARLRFLTTLDFPPFNFIDQSGKLSGFHVDLAREICRELEIEAKCQIQAVTYPELMPALEQGQGEAIAAGIAVTSELRQRFAFSRAFMQLPARFVVNTKAAGAMFNHANLRLPKAADGLLRHVIVTPDMHRIHHSVEKRETDSNYGFNLSVWDRLFSTYVAHPSRGDDGIETGLKAYGRIEPIKLLWSLVLPFRRG